MDYETFETLTVKGLMRQLQFSRDKMEETLSSEEQGDAEALITNIKAAIYKAVAEYNK